MKHFFMEYGKIIVVGALTVTGLMFTTPFAEAVTGSVANFTTGINDKYEPWELIDGDNVVLTDNDGDGVASKGDFLTFKASYLYSEGNTGPTEFLVLNSDGSTAELLATTDYHSANFIFPSVATTDSAGTNVQKYEGSTLDTLLNTAYFNSLSSNVQSKIKSKSITQNTWQRNGTPADATVSALDGSTYKYKKTGTVGTYNRNVYVLDIQDVIDYLGNSTTGAQVNKMFFNTETAQSEKYAWLRSAYFGVNTIAFRVVSSFGSPIGCSTASIHGSVNPAFTITLREGFF